MQRRVVTLKLTDVSEVRTTSIIRATHHPNVSTPIVSVSEGRVGIACVPYNKMLFLFPFPQKESSFRFSPKFFFAYTLPLTFFILSLSHSFLYLTFQIIIPTFINKKIRIPPSLSEASMLSTLTSSFSLYLYQKDEQPLPGNLLIIGCYLSPTPQHQKYNKGD
jgi:hypothetical protein